METQYGNIERDSSIHFKLQEDAHICNPDFDAKEEDFQKAGAGTAATIGGMSSSTFGSTATSDGSNPDTASQIMMGGQQMIGPMAMGAMTTSALLSQTSPPMIPSRNQTGLFGIYDGHGGVEVAEFVSRNFEEAFKSSPYYKQQNYEMALQETFLRMDDILMTPEGKMQVVEINK